MRTGSGNKMCVKVVRRESVLNRDCGWPSIAAQLTSWLHELSFVFGLGPPQLKAHRTPSWVTLGRLFNCPIEVRAVGFLWRRESERLKCHARNAAACHLCRPWGCSHCPVMTGHKIMALMFPEVWWHLFLFLFLGRGCWVPGWSPEWLPAEWVPPRRPEKDNSWMIREGTSNWKRR